MDAFVDYTLCWVLLGIFLFVAFGKVFTTLYALFIELLRALGFIK